MWLSTQAMTQRVDAVCSALNVEVCTLYQAHVRDHSLEIVATSGLNPDVVGTRLSWHQGLTGKVARTCEPRAARDLQNHRDHFHVEGSGEESFHSYLGIPLMHEDRLLGVLVIQTEATRTFSCAISANSAWPARICCTPWRHCRPSRPDRFVPRYRVHC